MQTDLPLFDTDEEALKSAVNHSGGAKAIGVMLWPDLAADVARDKLMNALNATRPERLKPSQVRLVLRQAHAAGYHAAAQWFMAESGYAVTVIEPKAQVDRCIEVVGIAAQALNQAVAMLDRVQRGSVLRAA